MKSIQKKSAAAFTYLELLLGLVITSIVGLSAVILIRLTMNNAAFILDRKEALSSIRIALNRIDAELLRVKSSDLLSISATAINYKDLSGNSTSFNITGTGNQMILKRGSDVLAENLSGGTFTYYDQAGSAITNYTLLSQVRRIRLDLTSHPKNNTGDISANIEIFPRNFYYTNFQ